MNIYRPLKPYNGIGWDKVVGDVCPSITFSRNTELVSVPSNNKAVYDKVIVDNFTPNESELGQLSSGDVKVLVPGKYLINVKHAARASTVADLTIQARISVLRGGVETTLDTWIIGSGTINEVTSIGVSHVGALKANDIVRVYIWISLSAGSIACFQESTSKIILTRIGD